MKDNLPSAAGSNLQLLFLCYIKDEISIVLKIKDAG